MKAIKDIFSWRWFMIMFTAVALSASFTACGDDDDDDGPNTNTESGLASQIIGTWICDDNVTSGWGYTFNANGNGYGIEYDYSYGEDQWPIRWRVSGNRIIITDMDVEDMEDFDQEILNVKMIDEDYMTVTFDEGDSYRVLKRVK